MTFAGTRCRITREIRIRVTIGIMIEMVMVAATVDIITAIRVA